MKRRSLLAGAGALAAAPLIDVPAATARAKAPKSGGWHVDPESGEPQLDPESGTSCMGAVLLSTSRS